jgi:hypothetical protein
MLQDPKWDEARAQPQLNDMGQCLLQAADYIEKHGWCQGSAVKPDGRVCIVGALDRIGANTEYICYKLHERIGNVPIWNDKSYRTKDEVTGLLRKMAYTLSK